MHAFASAAAAAARPGVKGEKHLSVRTALSEKLAQKQWQPLKSSELSSGDALYVLLF